MSTDQIEAWTVVTWVQMLDIISAGTLLPQFQWVVSVFILLFDFWLMAYQPLTYYF